MAVSIINRSKQLLVIPLNSGATVHLAPGEEASGIDPVETEHNGALQKMVQRGWLAVTEGKEEGSRSREAKKARSR